MNRIVVDNLPEELKVPVMRYIIRSCVPDASFDASGRYMYLFMTEGYDSLYYTDASCISCDYAGKITVYTLDLYLLITRYNLQMGKFDTICTQDSNYVARMVRFTEETDQFYDRLLISKSINGLLSEYMSVLSSTSNHIPFTYFRNFVKETSLGYRDLKDNIKYGDIKKYYVTDAAMREMVLSKVEYVITDDLEVRDPSQIRTCYDTEINAREGELQHVAEEIVAKCDSSLKLAIICDRAAVVDLTGIDMSKFDKYESVLIANCFVKNCGIMHVGRVGQWCLGNLTALFDVLYQRGVTRVILDNYFILGNGYSPNVTKVIMDAVDEWKHCFEEIIFTGQTDDDISYIYNVVFKEGGDHE